MAKENKDTVTKNEIVVGAISTRNSYSTYFDQNFNVDGSPSEVDLEDIFNAPQDNIENIIGYAKYCYRKYGIIMRTINITRDFAIENIKLNYPSKNKQVKNIIEKYNERIQIMQLLKDFMYELALTGNLACYDRDGKRVDIYPVNMITVVPLIKNNKQVIAYNISFDNIGTDSWDKETEKAIENAYPKEVIEAKKRGQDKAILNTDNAYFAKINSSQYESYGLSIILPAFEDLAHKSLLKETEKATSNDLINKILLIKIGDENNPPTRAAIEEYNNLFNGIKDAARVVVPYYFTAEFVEPKTTAFENDKFIEVDKDILNTLGISLSLIRGESGGNYSEGVINFTGLIKTIEGMREKCIPIIEGLYKAELKRNGMNPDLAPSVTFGDVVIDKEAKLNLVKELFVSAGLPYQVLYEEYGYDFDHIRLVREQENDENMDETFTLHSQPFQGNQDTNGSDNTQQEDEGGRPKGSSVKRNTDKTSSNDRPRTGLKNTNRRV